MRKNKSGHATETRSDRRNSFFENETIFVLITPRSKANLTTLISQNIMPGLYKKILPAQQPIRVCILLHHNKALAIFVALYQMLTT